MATTTSQSPAPAVGDHVIPRGGYLWNGRCLKQISHTVVAVHDYRPEGLNECVLVIQPTHEHDYLEANGFTINPEHGAYVGLDDVTAVA